jgi:hypothetical protein
MTTKQDKLPQDVWEAVVAIVDAINRKASAEELIHLYAALRNARRRHGLTHHDVAGVLME